MTIRRSTRIALLVAAIAAALDELFVVALLVGGRRETARAVAGFIPDCVVLFRRLLRDPRVPRRYKLALGLLVAYLAMPIDLVPDFIPVAGQLDDALVVALALRLLTRSGGRLFLLHDGWTPETGTVILLPDDGTIRWQFSN